MAIKVTIRSFDEDVNAHAQKGWQCPECYGIRISKNLSRFDANPVGYTCDECGCYWSREMEE